MAACTLVTILVITNLPAAPLWPIVIVTTFYWIFSSGRWVPAMAMITSSSLPGYRGSFMSINASLQQMAIGLASVVAGMVIGEAPNGELTGYSVAGLIAASSTAISILLAGRLRVTQEIAGFSQAVDSPDAEECVMRKPLRSQAPPLENVLPETPIRDSISA